MQRTEPPGPRPSTEVVDPIERTLRDLRRETVRVQEVYDFGLVPEMMEREWRRAAEVLPVFARALGRAGEIAGTLSTLESSQWNSGRASECWAQSLTHLAGALVTVGRLGGAPDARDLENALLAKVLYHTLAEMLDDVIDSGTYSQPAAAEIYRTALEGLGEPSYSAGRVAHALGGVLQPGEVAFAPSIARLGDALSQLLRSAAQWGRFSQQFHQGNERLARGQSWSVRLKGATLRRDALARAVATFDSPLSELAWYEQLAQSMGHVSNLALLDRCFIDGGESPAGVEFDLRAWWYYDVIIGTLDHLYDLRADCDAGIANLALLAMRPDSALEGRSAAETYQGLRRADYESLIQRLASLARIGAAYGERSGAGSVEYYRFLAALIPLVMFRSCKDQNRDLLDGVLRAFASVSRNSRSRTGAPAERTDGYPAAPGPQSTTYSQYSSPFRTQRVFTTVPLAPRALRIPSYAP